MTKDIAFLILYLIFDVVVAFILAFIPFLNLSGLGYVVLKIVGVLSFCGLELFLMVIIVSELHNIVKFLAVGLFLFPLITRGVNLRTNVQHNEEDRIQIVNGLYWLYPVVFYEGTAIDTIEVAIDYHTYGTGSNIGKYTIRKEDCCAIRDTNQLTTIISCGILYEVARGRQMRIEDYKGPHGTINVFSFIDENGKRVRRDFHGEDVDEKSYTVNVYDESDYVIYTY